MSNQPLRLSSKQRFAGPCWLYVLWSLTDIMYVSSTQLISLYSSRVLFVMTPLLCPFWESRCMNKKFLKSQYSIGLRDVEFWPLPIKSPMIFTWLQANSWTFSGVIRRARSSSSFSQNLSLTSLRRLLHHCPHFLKRVSAIFSHPWGSPMSSSVVAKV